eukprot:jgi/Phyca11/15077/fgenesh1_pg.PHYCAscaffold_11_\
MKKIARGGGVRTAADLVADSVPADTVLAVADSVRHLLAALAAETGDSVLVLTSDALVLLATETGDLGMALKLVVMMVLVEKAGYCCWRRHGGLGVGVGGGDVVLVVEADVAQLSGDSS